MFVSIGEAMVELAAEADARFRRGFAGDTLNTAWAVRALAPDALTVRYVTALGRDRHSTQLRAFLVDAGIDAGSIRDVPERRIGLYLITLHGHERSFDYWRDLSAARLLAADPDFLRAALRDATMAYLSGITLAILSPADRAALLDVLAGFRRRGGLVAFDGNVRPALWEDGDAARHALDRAYRLADIALPTAEDEMTLFGDADAEGTLGRLAACGVREAVVKRGPEACLLLTPEGRTDVPAEIVRDPVDTSGAGDGFNGAYLASRLSGTDPVRAVRIAHAVAGQIIRTRGALLKPSALRTAAATG